ncbi:hypothetical protein CPB86DRAFT_236386 [Serendipita vermifera]|nr:hypothetical protein CPB86DRAFT_236386 [Serendipita vermifera]
MAKTLKDLLADDVQKIMVSLYDLQKGVNQSSDSVFATARKELRNQWEILRVYLQRCHSFGEDVATLKDAIGGHSKEALIEFLGDMRESANELRQVSKKLNENDMSKAFSMGIPDGATRQASISFIKIDNENWKAFVACLGSVPQSSLDLIRSIDTALAHITSHVGRMSEFWEHTYKACDAIITESPNKKVFMTVEDANTIAENWKGYQSAMEKAIVSITKTNDAILVAADVRRTNFGVGSSITRLLEYFLPRKWGSS